LIFCFSLFWRSTPLSDSIIQEAAYLEVMLATTSTVLIMADSAVVLTLARVAANWAAPPINSRHF